MRDLSDLMHANVQAREESIADLVPSPGALAGTVRRVRRRRTVRHSVQGVGAGAAVVVLAGASWFGLRGTDEPVPAETPTPTPTPTVSAPAPTPTPTPTVVLDEIVGLPPTQALPPGLLEQTTAGWVLAIYESAPRSPSGPDRLPPVTSTVVLASPTGDLYRVLDLPLDQSWQLLRWEAGSTTAVVTGGAGPRVPEDPSRFVLDLESGTVEPTDLGLRTTGPYGNYYVGDTADGAELWTEVTSSDAYTSDVYRITEGGAPELVGGIGSRTLLDPARRWMVSDTFSGSDSEVFVLLDVVDGGSTEHSFGVPGQRCDMVGWLDLGQLLAFCLDAGYRDAGITAPVDAHAAYYRIDVSPSSATATLLARLGPSDPRPSTWQDGWVAPGTVAFPASSAPLDEILPCADDVYLWSGQAGVATRVAPGASSYSVASGPSLLVKSGTGCGDDERHAPSTLRSFDVTSGTWTVLAGEPSPSPDGTPWASGLGWWVVGR